MIIQRMLVVTKPGVDPHEILMHYCRGFNIVEVDVTASKPALSSELFSEYLAVAWSSSEPMSFDDWLKNEYGMELRGNRIFSRINPNGVYSGYILGGNSNKLLVKEGGKIVSTCEERELSFSLTNEYNRDDIHLTQSGCYVPINLLLLYDEIIKTGTERFTQMFNSWDDSDVLSLCSIQGYEDGRD